MNFFNLKLEKHIQNGVDGNIKNMHYEDADNEFQTIDEINELTKDAPFVIYLPLKGEDKNGYGKLLVPSDTMYLFLEDGYLCASNVPLSLNVDIILKHKLQLLEYREKDNLLNKAWGNPLFNWYDYLKHLIDNNLELHHIKESCFYTFDDVPIVTRLAKLDKNDKRSLYGVYVLDKWNNVLEVVNIVDFVKLNFEAEDADFYLDILSYKEE